jgi:Flp pilus assembly CpaE family ATPase
VKIALLVAAAGAPWEAAVLRAFDGDELGISVTRRCVDVVELLSVAGAGHGRAALIDGSLRRLDADTIDRLRAADVVPIGVVTRGDAESENRMRAMGVDSLVSTDADPRVVAGVVHEAVAGGTDGTRVTRSFAGAVQGPADEPEADPAAVPARAGSVVAVWGPAGAPGRTTVAAGLADEISRLGAAALLVDADVYGGSVATVLGVLDESPGLAAACRAAGARRLDGRGLAAFAWQVTPLLRVLTGIPLAERWPEIRASGVTAVLAAARELADWTVVDCAFALETDEELSFDSIAPRRNGATLAVLDAADAVVAVGACDPVGLQRLVRGLAALREAEVSAPVHVVVNKSRRFTVGGDPHAEATTVLQRFAGCEPIASLPYDREALDAAIAAGRLLSEAKPSSPLRQSLVGLARTLTGIESRSERRRRRR